jgi:hypothetical protein
MGVYSTDAKLKSLIYTNVSPILNVEMYFKILILIVLF